MDEYNNYKLDFIKNVEAPCALFVPIDSSLENGIREVNSFNIDKILDITNRLRKDGMDAVPCFYEEASDPSKIVVTAGGIQTPILKPKKAKEVAEQIYFTLFDKQLKEKGCLDYNLGLAFPVEISQMADISPVSKRYMEGNSINPDFNNPESDKIREKYGFDLEEKLYHKVINSSKLIPVEDFDSKNEKKLTSLYRGGTIGDMPYVSLAARESKNIAYSSPDIKTALIYSGCGHSPYGSKISIPTASGDSICFGFVYEFDAGKDCSLYQDYSIEQGFLPTIKKKTSDVLRTDWDGCNFEQPIFPSKNKLKNIYMHVRKDEKDYLYPIDQKDDHFKALLALYRPTDTSKRGYMIDRRKKILKDKKVYSDVKSKILGIFTKKLKPYELNLPKEELIKIANMTIEDKREKQRQEEIQSNKKSRKPIIKHLRHLRGVDRPLVPSQITPKVASTQSHSIYIAKKGKEI